MTCIIGFKDPETKKLYVGGDSAGVSGYDITIRTDKKVFRNGSFIIGFTTSFRMGQLLQYCFTPPEMEDGIDDMKFMVNVFIPKVKSCLEEGGWQKSKDSQDQGGRFIVAHKGELYQIDSDYQVGKAFDNIMSVGCGRDIAIGAMYALNHLCPKDRITKSLEIASYLNAGVRPPFIIEEL